MKYLCEQFHSIFWQLTPEECARPINIPIHHMQNFSSYRFIDLFCQLFFTPFPRLILEINVQSVSLPLLMLLLLLPRVALT